MRKSHRDAMKKATDRMIVEKKNEKTISVLFTCGKENPKKSPFSYKKRESEKIFIRSEKWKGNFISFHKKSLILFFLIDKNSFFHDFLSCKKRNSKKFLFFSHVNRKIPQKKFFSRNRDAKFRISFLFFAITLTTKNIQKT